MEQPANTIFKHGTKILRVKSTVTENGETIVELVKPPRQRKYTYVKKDKAEWKPNGRPAGSKDKKPRVRAPKAAKVLPLTGIAKDLDQLPQEYKDHIEKAAGGKITLTADTIVVNPELINSTVDTQLDNVEHEEDLKRNDANTQPLPRVYKTTQSKRGRPRKNPVPV